MSIIFRDRPLKPSEQYHHHCTECGIDLHPDFAYSHKCNPVTLGFARRKKLGVLE